MAIAKYMKTCLTYTKYASITIFAASMTSAWYYRPLADTSNSKHDNYYNDDNSSSNRKLKSTTLHDGQQKPPILSTDSTTSATATSTYNYNDDDRRTKEFFCAPTTSPPWCREHVPLLLNWARRISIGVTTIAIRILMNTYGRYEIKDDEYYHDFLDAVLNVDDGSEGQTNDDGTSKKKKSNNGRRRRKHNQGLITVSNHRSLFDDPGIVSCLLPLPKAIQPQYNRWALCSQEYCFNDALPGIIKGYLGAGQVLPICRGGGINQKLLLDFGRHLACGEWCHVFPEGGVWQWDELGGRRELPPNSIIASSSDFGRATGGDASDEEDDTIQKIIPATAQQRKLGQSSLGKLKWGVGKLIAHAPITPKVIPFAHVGMEKLLPQDETTGKTKLRNDMLSSLLPSILLGGGNTNDDDDKLQVKIQFGKEITFDDLIHEHESKHGKLWKYCGRDELNNTSSSEEEDEYDQKQKQGLMLWKSSYEERVLYSKIVRRIECRLDVLTKQVCQKEDG